MNMATNKHKCICVGEVNLNSLFQGCCFTFLKVTEFEQSYIALDKALFQLKSTHIFLIST